MEVSKQSKPGNSNHRTVHVSKERKKPPSPTYLPSCNHTSRNILRVYLHRECCISDSLKSVKKCTCNKTCIFALRPRAALVPVSVVRAIIPSGTFFVLDRHGRKDKRVCEKEKKIDLKQEEKARKKKRPALVGPSNPTHPLSPLLSTSPSPGSKVEPFLFMEPCLPALPIFY